MSYHSKKRLHGSGSGFWKRVRTMLQRWAGKQPTVGLALGGGGVRGLAHVGVLEVFRRENIPVAAIAGSSMGAIVAAAYTLNPDYSETQLIDVLNEMSAAIPEHLKSTLPDHADRESIFERLRQFVYVERFILNSVSGWGMLPEGIAEASLNKLTPKKHLEESPIPLAVVSADLISGKKIIFRSGPAALALKASSAIPGFLPPVPYNDMLLVDGAIVSIVPAEVVREMGVDIVVAVDVDQEGEEVEITNGPEAFLRAVALCSYHHKQHHLESANMVIQPQFGAPVQTFDISKARLCIEAGARAAEAALPRLRKLLGWPRA